MPIPTPVPEMKNKREKTFVYRRYRDLAGRHRRLLVIGVLAGVIAGIASGFGVPFFVQHVFRQIFEDTETEYSLWYLLGVAALLPAVFVVRGIAVYINQYFLHWTTQNILLDIRGQLFEKLQVLPVSYFERRQSGDLMAKLVGDTLQVQQAVQVVARDAFVQPFTFLAGLGYLIYLSVSQQQAGFLLLLFVLAPLMVAPVRYIGGRLRRRSKELQQTLGELTDIMAENLRGVVEVRSFNLQQTQQKRFGDKLRAYNRFAMKIAKYYHLTQPFMEVLAVSMVSVAFLYSYREGVGFSAFAAMGAALFFTVDAVKRLVKMLNGLQRVSGSFDRIETVLTEEETVRDPDSSEPLGRVRGHLELREVRFQYEDRAAHPDLRVNHLEIPAGTTVALVGPSGSGKSTFVKLLPRFYDPQSGSVLLDGRDIRTLRKEDLRRQMALVPQAPVLFNGTVRDNLRLAHPKASEDAVRRAAEQANAHEFIEELPNGYDTIVGENAVRLSGGQRQRLALARAILKDAPILILDEATSALDAESEQRIQAALRELARSRTLILIAHRFATIRIASRLLLFDRGRIRRSGSFEELMQDDLFCRLHESQLL